MSGMLEVRYDVTNHKVTYLARIDNLTTLPMIPGDIKRSLGNRRKENERMELVSGLYKITNLDDRYSKVSATFGKKSNMTLVQADISDQLVEDGWVLCGYATNNLAGVSAIERTIIVDKWMKCSPCD